MRKKLKRQQVEKMFKSDINIINSRLNNLNEEQTREIYWSQLLNCLYKNGGITKHQYCKWSCEKTCN